MAAIFQIEHPTPSIVAYLLGEHLCQISSRLHLKLYGGFLKRLLEQERHEYSDVRSVPGLKIRVAAENDWPTQFGIHPNWTPLLKQTIHNERRMHTFSTILAFLVFCTADE